MSKDADAYRTISEVAEALDVPAHVLRFWETKFTQVRPMKRGGGRRYYRRADVDLLQSIRRLLYEDAYTIRGVQRLLKAQGPGAVASMGPEHAATPETRDADRPADRADGAAHLPEPRPMLPLDGERSAAALLEALAAEVAACRDLLMEALARSPERLPDR